MPKVSKQSPTKKSVKKKVPSKPVAKKQSTKLGAHSFEADMVAVNEMDHPGLKVNLYGRSGTGKTSFACTFPKPLLLLGAENGARSVSNYDDVIFKPVASSETIAEVVEYIRDENASIDFASICLDTATFLQEIVLKEMLGIDDTPVQLSWGIATQQIWGQVALQMKELLRGLLDLSQIGKNIVIISQERDFNTENSDPELNLTSVGSALTPSVTGWLNPACDYILQTYIKPKYQTSSTKIGDSDVEMRQKTGEYEFCLRTGLHSVFTTKFRKPRTTKKLPAYLVDPSYDKILEYL